MPAVALKAYTEGDYEAFYDFARRSVAAGPPRDAKLMLLLARAESLTGRVDDAKRTLERLARMGVKVDIAGNDDFGNLRAAGPAGSTSAARAAFPSAALAATGDKSVDKPNGPLEVASESLATRISPTGLAYDHVSGRFLMADSSSDKLVSVDELSRHMVDLVKADSAGFGDITAFEIDTRRGDLWVVSAGKPGGTDHESVTALHKLQLISGRPLAKFQPGDGFGDTRFEDVAVATSGDVFVLDAAGGRIFDWRRGRRPCGWRAACGWIIPSAWRWPATARLPTSRMPPDSRVSISLRVARRVWPRRNPCASMASSASASTAATSSAPSAERTGFGTSCRSGSPEAQRRARWRSNGWTASCRRRRHAHRAVRRRRVLLTREAGHDGEDGEFVVQRARVR